MKRLLVVAVVLFLSGNAYAEKWIMPVDSNQRQALTYTTSVGAFANVTTGESNRIKFCPEAYQLSLKISSPLWGLTQETITFDSRTISIGETKREIDAAYIKGLQVRILEEVTTDTVANYRNFYLNFFVPGNTASIQVVNTLNTSTDWVTQTYGSAAEWQTGDSCTYIDSSGVTGWIKIDTGVTGISTATFASAVYDRGGMEGYDTLVAVVMTVYESVSGGTQMNTFYYRSGDTSVLTGAFTESTSGTVTTPNRYFQWYVKMSTTESPSSPRVDTVTLASYCYNVYGDSCFVMLGLDNQVHYSEFDFMNLAFDGSPASSANPIPTTDTPWYVVGGYTDYETGGAYDIDLSNTFVSIAVKGRVRQVLIVADGALTDSCDIYVSTNNNTWAYLKGGEHINLPVMFMWVDPVINLTRKGNSDLVIRVYVFYIGH